MSLLDVSGLTKEFGDLTAVDEVDFAVEDGEFVSILGPSGSGKSTALRMVAGFETPTAGSIQLEGEEVVGKPPFERDVNMVFQDLALFPHLTVAENIGYGLKQRGVPADERRERSERMLEMVRLEGYGDRMPEELSGGEQQRVALARALVNEPALVLFDEPLSSLDRKLRQHMQSELQRIQTETDTTFLYVTHDQEVALAVSDRLIVLNEGQTQQIGTVEELYEEPASEFVADFIGDVNTVPGTVSDREDDRFVITLGTGDVSVPQAALSADDGSADGVTIGDSISVCVRPYQVQLTAADASIDDRMFSITGTVRSRNYQGSDSLYGVETDGWGRIAAEVRGGGFEIGDSVAVVWDPEDIHVFQRDSAATDASGGS